MRHYGREYLGHWVLALLPLDYGSRQRSLHVLRVPSHSDGRLQPRSPGLEHLAFQLLLISGFWPQPAEG